MHKVRSTIKYQGDFQLQSDSEVSIVCSFVRSSVHKLLNFSSIDFLINHLYSSLAQLFANFKTFRLVNDDLIVHYLMNLFHSEYRYRCVM